MYQRFFRTPILFLIIQITPMQNWAENKWSVSEVQGFRFVCFTFDYCVKVFYIVFINVNMLDRESEICRTAWLHIWEGEGFVYTTFAYSSDIAVYKGKLKGLSWLHEVARSFTWNVSLRISTRRPMGRHNIPPDLVHCIQSVHLVNSTFMFFPLSLARLFWETTLSFFFASLRSSPSSLIFSLWLLCFPKFSSPDPTIF